MMHFLYSLLKTIYLFEERWSKILIKKEADLNQQKERLDLLFQLFKIMTIRKEEIPETGDFIIRFKRLDLVTDFEDHPEKYAIIEEDK